MAAREDMGQDIAPGVIQRISQGLAVVISGVNPANWFGPLQPLQPLKQEETVGRQFQYPVGYNLRIQPRTDDGAIPFSALRAFADAYDLLRLVIETRKDQIEAYNWEIVPADDKAPKGSMDKEIAAVTDFLQMPDRELMWPQWLRKLLEELFVIDAMAIYPRANRGGSLHALEIMDGATLKRLIDVDGRTPLPPDPAFQQILHGVPANDLTTDDLIYIMRNPRANRIYGHSPVEQVLMTVNIALRRQVSQLARYTEGNIPEALAQVPETWTSGQIADFQTWFDGLLAGNTPQKRRITFIPKMEGIVFPRLEALKDEYDEWLARIICYCFSVSPSPFIKQQNRSNTMQMADTAKEEGLQPLLKFISQVMTRIITTCMVPGLRFQFETVNRTEPLQQAQIDDLYIKDEVLTPDEVRTALGREPLTPEQREAAFPQPMMDTIQANAGGDNQSAQLSSAGKPPATKKPKENTASNIAKALEGVEIHIHQAPVTVDAPIQMGDVHAHVPAPVVKVYGDTNIVAPPMPVPLKKRITATRGEQGKLFAEVEIEPDKDAMVGTLEKLAKGTRHE